MGFRVKEVDELCFKAEHISMQRSIKIHGSKGKDSAMKEMKKLTMNNSCFGDIDHAAITQETKDGDLLLLMFIVLKRNGDLKKRGVSNRKKQRL